MLMKVNTYVCLLHVWESKMQYGLFCKQQMSTGT